MRTWIILLLILPFSLLAQKKKITLEAIYQNETFRSNAVPGFVEEEISKLVKDDDVIDEKGRKIPLDDVLLSPDRKKLLVFTGREKIYRRSSKAFAYIHDIISKKTRKLNTDKLLHSTFSPDGKRIAFVKDNNLFLYEIDGEKLIAITTDGKRNHIINGNCDWVYEEEFEFTKAFEWSPNGRYIAYYRFDESNVKEFQFTQYDNSYNNLYTYKYPKAGEVNSIVEIHIYEIATNKKVNAEFEKGDIYIPRIKWTKEDEQLVVFWMNRHQNDLKLLATNAGTGASRVLYEEKNKYFVEINDDWMWLRDGKHFLFTSEMHGFRHIYIYSNDGKTRVQLSHGNHEVTEINGVDENNKLVYFTMAYPRPMDRNFFVTDYAGKKTFQLTTGEGWHKVELNADFSRYYDFHSDINTPKSVSFNEITIIKKKMVRTRVLKIVDENTQLKSRLLEYGITKAEFIKVPNSKGDTLNGWMLLPANFNLSEKYPVLFCNYGGPGSQQVSNQFGAVSMWHQYLSQKGFIVVSVDNTGTGYRGEEFKKKTYLQLGKFEIEDQVDAARWMGNLSYVDKSRIGHWGWSYGGFMSSLAITKGADVFSAAVAVAPVTSWRFYDNIYTERYMRTPQENPGGYDDNSPINHTEKLKGKYLIIHGTADDNVHFQNSTQMVSALVRSNKEFESAYYPNKNHRISGTAPDNTTIHIWTRMSKWIIENLGKEKYPTGASGE